MVPPVTGFAFGNSPKVQYTDWLSVTSQRLPRHCEPAWRSQADIQITLVSVGVAVAYWVVNHTPTTSAGTAYSCYCGDDELRQQRLRLPQTTTTTTTTRTPPSTATTTNYCSNGKYLKPLNPKMPENVALEKPKRSRQYYTECFSSL